jgi:hypothetical protein
MSTVAHNVGSVAASTHGWVFGQNRDAANGYFGYGESLHLRALFIFVILETLVPYEGTRLKHPHYTSTPFCQTPSL